VAVELPTQIDRTSCRLCVGHSARRIGAAIHTLAAESVIAGRAAEVAGRYGDGLWTFPDPVQAPKLIETYRTAAAEAGRTPGTIVLEAAFSWAPDDADALEAARVWKGAVPDEFYTDDWFDPQAMYERGEQEVSDEDFKQRSIISADPGEHVERIKQLEQMVDGEVVVKLSNQSGPNALEAIRIYGERVLPKLRG